jgi:hypothetical protein
VRFSSARQKSEIWDHHIVRPFLSVTAGTHHMKLSGRRILVLVSDTMVANSIRDVLEQEGGIVAVGAFDASPYFDAMIVDGECSHRPVVKSLLDGGVRMIAYTGDSASFQKRFPGTPVISKPAADAHFVSAVALLLTKPEEPDPVGQ